MQQTVESLDIIPGEQKTGYFEKRMQLLGVTSENNAVSLLKYDPKKSDNVLTQVPIFSKHPDGIKIIVYTIDRIQITYSDKEVHIKENGHEKQTGGSRWKKEFAIIRLENPIEKDGHMMKYRLPKGAGTFPFFPPNLIEKFENKQPIECLVLTEGYFKAFKGSIHGVDIIGLSSITHMKNREDGALHLDIAKILKTGTVKRIVWLTDGDCLDITSKEITEEKDLYTRPKNFFASIETFKTLLDDYDIEKWFFHIDTDSILSNFSGMTRDQVKGLDDLLINLPDRVSEIIEDINSIGKNSIWFSKHNITYGGLHKMHKYFHLTNVDEFFFFHAERRKELYQAVFKFYGTKYKYNDEKKACEIVTPGEASLYFRVADSYFKHIEKPNQYGKIERVIQERKKTTIIDDHGKTFPRHIPKYEDFCNVPDHNNFQQIIHGCFNVYSPLDYMPDEDKCTEDDCPCIINLIKHIWGEKTATYYDKDTDARYTYSNYELGLDYLQLLYQNPSQKMPILCLVSKENGTGKSTLGFFLRNMLGSNVAIVGNADLANDFNSHWATKSVVICDEAKIDKHQVIEKIKALSTAKKIYMNAKGRAQVELDCFIKFILITNNEDNFITASEDDIRYWVLKVPVLMQDDPKALNKMVDEIPAFLSFLNHRKMVTVEKSRMWFHKDLLQTEALKKVIENSAPTIVKEIRSKIKSLFLDTGLEQIKMTPDIIVKEILKKYTETNYLINTLKDRLKVYPYHVWIVSGRNQEYNTEDEALAAAGVLFPDDPKQMLYGRIERRYKTTRFTYPSYTEKFESGKKEMILVHVKSSGRPYVFYRKNFVSKEEDAAIILDAETKNMAEMDPDSNSGSQSESGNPLTQEDLPF